MLAQLAAQVTSFYIFDIQTFTCASTCESGLYKMEHTLMQCNMNRVSSDACGGYFGRQCLLRDSYWRALYSVKCEWLLGPLAASPFSSLGIKPWVLRLIAQCGNGGGRVAGHTLLLGGDLQPSLPFPPPTVNLAKQSLPYHTSTSPSAAPLSLAKPSLPLPHLHHPFRHPAVNR